MGNLALAGETPKYGGTLTYMIPADAPPSLDGHRETTYATVHSAAPFYSVLIRSLFSSAMVRFVGSGDGGRALRHGEAAPVCGLLQCHRGPSR
jgi:hypothetical protein